MPKVGTEVVTRSIGFGATGAEITPVDASHGLPVEIVAGTVTVDATGLATAAKQDTQITAEQAMQATLGATTGAAVTTDANGTIQQYLRGLVVLFVNFLTRIPGSLGSKSAATSFAVTQSTEDAAQLGSLTETAPATDTASSGLNGRLQRIAQRITSLVAIFTSPFPLATTPWTYAAAASGIANTTTAVTVAAATASVKNYVSGMQIMWEALTTATEIAIRDGAGGTVLWRAKIPASLAGTREVIFPVPISGTANTLLEIVTLTASGAGAVYWNLQGFKAA